MPRYAAFLRGINLGNRRLTMNELRRHFEALEVDDVATFLASGNVIFSSALEDTAALEGRIEDHLAEALDYTVDTFIRPLERLAKVTEQAAAEAGREEGFNPHVIFLKEAADGGIETRLTELETPDDVFHVLGREVVWLRRGRLTDSPVKTRDLETALGGATSTMRNLNTVRRIVRKFG
jgi:uncharacterized protein (DUF1697 family)